MSFYLVSLHHTPAPLIHARCRDQCGRGRCRVHLKHACRLPLRLPRWDLALGTMDVGIEAAIKSTFCNRPDAMRFLIVQWKGRGNQTSARALRLLWHVHFLALTSLLAIPLLCYIGSRGPLLCPSDSSFRFTINNFTTTTSSSYQPNDLRSTI